MNSNRSFTWTGPAGLFCLLVALPGCADGAMPVAPDPTPSLSMAANAPLAPVRLAFEKCLIDPTGIWEGEVTGDVTGDLRTELTALRTTGPVWHVRFDWVITAGDRSFTADLAGTLNTRTGRVEMDGRVVDGYLDGARVHEEGQLVDAANSCFEGVIRIMPATAH